MPLDDVAGFQPIANFLPERCGRKWGIERSEGRNHGGCAEREVSLAVGSVIAKVFHQMSSTANGFPMDAVVGAMMALELVTFARARNSAAKSIMAGSSESCIMAGPILKS